MIASRAGLLLPRAALLLALGVVSAAGTWRAVRAPIPPGLFRDVTRQAGLAFRYDNDPTPGHRFVETTGGGCAWLDYDNDGRPDLFAVQGGPVDNPAARTRPRHALY